MSLRENRFLLGILFPIVYEISLIEAYLLILPENTPSPFNLIPAVILLFPAFMFYVYSPYILFNLSRAQDRYLAAHDGIVGTEDTVCCHSGISTRLRYPRDQAADNLS